MLDHLAIAAIFIFPIAILLFIATFTNPFSPHNCKKQIKKAREKYTVPLNAKCIRLDERIVTHSYSERLSDNPHAEGPHVYAKNIKVNQPTYCADYAGHSRCFYKRNLDYKPNAIVGEYYTIYLNPNDDKYRDFVDDFFYEDRAHRLKKMLVFRYICLLFVFVSAITFLSIVSINVG